MTANRKLTYLALSEPQLDPRPQKHSRQQARAIARSNENFGLNAPIQREPVRSMAYGHCAVVAMAVGLDVWLLTCLSLLGVSAGDGARSSPRAASAFLRFMGAA